MTRHCRRWVLGLLATALPLGPLAEPAGAWGPRGHRVAARVAEARLTSEARAGIRALLHEGDSLADIANWADHEGHDAVPGSASWHYVNVPLSAAHYDPKACPESGCVVTKIGEYRAQVADRSLPKADRARALLFLVHFTADVHQPLHVGDNRDKGGNGTQVLYLRKSVNLHRLWDSRLIDEASRDDRDLLNQVEPLLTPENVDAWSRGGVERWADESLQDAKVAYDYPPRSARPLRSGANLGADYAEVALPIIRRRLAQSGVRLANELNAAFAETPLKPADADAPAQAK